MNGSKDLKTIIYFKGVYDTLDLFTDHLIEAFESMGYGTFVYHTANEEVCKKMLLRLLDESQEFAVVTFNNLGYNLSFEQSEAAEDEEKKPEEHNIWNYFHIPYIDILMDHPFHYEKPLCNMPETAVILCTDRNHVKYIRRFFKNIHRTDFLPHAGVELGHKHKPLNDRNIDVLYAGALPIYTVAKMIPDLHSIPEVDGEHMMQSVLGELVQHPEQTTEQAIEAYVKSVRGDISDERLQEIIEFQLKVMNSRLNYPLIFHHLDREPGLIYEDRMMTVHAFPLKHRYEAPVTGFLFAEKEKERNIKREMTDAFQVPVAFMHRLKKGEDFVTPDGEIIANGRLTTAPPAPRSYAYMTDTHFRESNAEFEKGVA